MFAAFRNKIPALSAWMESCYSTQPLLFFGDEHIKSCCGVQQGDPLGPLGFALTLHPIVEQIKAEVHSLNLNAWYLDDGTLVGTSGDLATALHIVESDGPSVGLHLNRGKSLLFVPSTSDLSLSSLPRDIPVTHDGFALLGCPIGPPSFCEKIFASRISKVKASLSALNDLCDAQLETTLLRSCLALPKVSYILRTCPPNYISTASKDFDDAIRITLETIIGGPLSEWSWLKATLSSSRGGLSLRSASLHSPAAFLSSSIRSDSMIEKMLCHSPGSSSHITAILLLLWPHLLLIQNGILWMILMFLFIRSVYRLLLMRLYLRNFYLQLPLAETVL